MSKSAEMSKVLAVVVLILMILGIGVCFVPLPKQMPVAKWMANIGAKTENISSQQSLIRERYENALAHKITDALVRVVGADRVVVSVKADMELTDEVLKEIKENKISETEIKIRHQTERIKSVFVNVVIDGVMVNSRRGKAVYQPRSQQDMKQYESIVKAVMGYDSKRGDRVVIQNIPFVENGAVWGSVPVSVIGDWVVRGIWAILLIGIVGGILFPNLKRLTREPTGVFTNTTLKKAIDVCMQNPERAAGVLKRWVYSGKKRISPRQYSYAEQAGIVMLAVGDRVSRMVMGALTEKDIREIGKRIATLGKVPMRDIQIALNHFISDYQMPSAVFGTQDRLKELLKNTVQNSKGLYSEISLDSMGKSVWEVLGQMDVEHLSEWLSHKKPESIAVILYHLAPQTAGRVMGVLPKEIGARALIHLTHLKRVPSGVVEKMTREVAEDVMTLLNNSREMTGADKIVEMFKTLSPTEKEKWMTAIARQNAAVGIELATHLKNWEDVLGLSADKIGKLLMYADEKVLARALSITPEQKRAVFIGQIPTEIYEQMRRKFTVLAGQKAEAKKAQDLIVKTAQKLGLF